MTNHTKSHALCVAASMALMTMAPASAFAYSGQSVPVQDGQRAQVDQNAPRASRGRTSNRVPRNAPAAPAAPTPEQNLANAQQLFAANNVACEMTEANLRGQTGDMRSVYEVACANNFGYLALTGKEATAEAAAIEPAFIECSEAKVTYDRQLAATPDAPPPPKCDLPTNDNFLAVYTSMAAQAGLDCTVDDGIIVGRKGAISVYEIGCAGVQGARINRTAENGWEKASCLELAQANVTCTYTTKEETIASAKAWFASNEATNCDISDVRYMGANANGAFYEAACNGKEGFIARLNNAKAVEQVYACSVAQQIGDGCKLSTVEAAPAA